MAIELVTFDCAHTLLRVNWRLGEFAVECAREAGLDLDEAAAALYQQIYSPRHSQYLKINLAKDHGRADAFWQEISRAWLTELGHDADQWFPRIDAVSQDIGFGPNSRVFQLYEDVLPCLDELDRRGIKKAVISNWDYSLHKVLRALGLYDRFDLIVASLEEGFEKPDPRIFLQSLGKLGVEPAHALHVGDDPVDDLQGARNVGMRALLIDRKLDSPSPPYLASLRDLHSSL